MITIDGGAGEGGGQILRTALSLSMVRGTPFAIENIRAKRPRPGLQRQHLTCVQAAQKISGADGNRRASGIDGVDLCAGCHHQRKLRIRDRHGGLDHVGFPNDPARADACRRTLDGAAVGGHPQSDGADLRLPRSCVLPVAAAHGRRGDDHPAPTRFHARGRRRVGSQDCALHAAADQHRECGRPAYADGARRCVDAALCDCPAGGCARTHAAQLASRVWPSAHRESGRAWQCAHGRDRGRRT